MEKRSRLEYSHWERLAEKCMLQLCWLAVVFLNRKERMMQLWVAGCTAAAAPAGAAL